MYLQPFLHYITHHCDVCVCKTEWSAPGWKFHGWIASSIQVWSHEQQRDATQRRTGVSLVPKTKWENASVMEFRPFSAAARIGGRAHDGNNAPCRLSSCDEHQRAAVRLSQIHIRRVFYNVCVNERKKHRKKFPSCIEAVRSSAHGRNIVVDYD